jgi:aryl-alcohol dehydrogenase-like predicted oxidoreductase
VALGTVQFGLPYGIANEAGQVTGPEAAAILRCAWSAGIDTLDTAISYGESEQRLGEIGVRDWRVVTKVPPVPDSVTDVAAWVRAAVSGSLDRLRISSLHAVLLHRADQLLGARGDALYRALRGLRESGVTGKIGVSVYSPDDLDALCPRFAFDLVQAPLNVFDRRFISSGWFSRLHDQGVEIHARSVFLQGVLLMDAATRPAQFNGWHSLFTQWDRWLGECGLTPVEACLGFVLSRAEVGRAVIGVDTVGQLRDVLAAAGPIPFECPPELTCTDPRLVNPSHWVSR